MRVEPGKALGLTGPNGSGKSVLLEIAAGITPPDSGSVSVFGVDPFKRWREALRIIGYVSQLAPSHRMGKLTVQEYLRYSASIHGLKGRKLNERVKAMMSLFELERFAGSPLAGLSAGERKRVRFAGEIIHDPKALILDEPFATLDMRWREILMGVLRELKAMGKALFIASVTKEDLEGICEEILPCDFVIKGGETCFSNL